MASREFTTVECTLDLPVADGNICESIHGEAVRITCESVQCLYMSIFNHILSSRFMDMCVKEAAKQYSDILEPSMKGRLDYTLMNDFLAKYSFQNDLYALQGLLAALLRIQPEEITFIKILNPIEPGSAITDKNCILDINLEINHKTRINIEIQSRFQDFWPERSITYLCRNFDHLKEGESFSKVKSCVQIGILNNDLFKKDDPRYTDEFFVEYELMSKTKHTGYSGKFQLKMLLLNHLEEADEQDKNRSNGLYYWAKLFKASSWEELKMISKDNPRMESLIGTVRKLSAEEKISLACEARRRYLQDVATYNEEIQNLEEKLGKAEEQLGRAEEQLGRAEEQLGRTEEQLGRTEEQLGRTEEQLGKTEEQLGRTEEQLERTEKARDQALQEVEQVNAEKQELLKMIEALRKELESKDVRL